MGRRRTSNAKVEEEFEAIAIECWCQDDHIGVTKVVSTEELKSRHREIALDVTIEILAKFGWISAPRDPLSEAADSRFEK